MKNIIIDIVLCSVLIIFPLIIWNICIQEVDFRPYYYESPGKLEIIPRFGPLSSFGIVLRSPNFRKKYGWGHLFIEGKYWPDDTFLNHTSLRNKMKEIESVGKLYRNDIQYLEKELRKYDNIKDASNNSN